jgi:hypothetical protein
MVMKASRWLLGVILSLVVLLSACSQNSVPEGVLEPEANFPVRIVSGLSLKATALNDICRRYAPLCNMVDESLYLPVEVDPLCSRALCNNPLEVVLEGNCRFDLVVPELTQTPSQFAKNFKLELVDRNGKVLAQGLADTKTPRLEAAAKLPKGTFNLRVTLSSDMAKLVQASPEKHSFNFFVSVVK